MIRISKTSFFWIIWTRRGKICLITWKIIPKNGLIGSVCWIRRTMRLQNRSINWPNSKSFFYWKFSDQIELLTGLKCLLSSNTEITSITSNRRRLISRKSTIKAHKTPQYCLFYRQEPTLFMTFKNLQITKTFRETNSNLCRSVKTWKKKPRSWYWISPKEATGRCSKIAIFYRIGSKIWRNCWKIWTKPSRLARISDYGWRPSRPTLFLLEFYKTP